MSEFISEREKNDIVRCAVEWYEARRFYGDAGYLYAEARGSEMKYHAWEVKVMAEHEWYKTWGALDDAVKRWKEAQA